MSRWLIVALVASRSACVAADSSVAAIGALLSPMRGEKAREAGPRGASLQLTSVKHELRDWIESRMKPFDRLGDAAKLTSDVNSELRRAGLLCGWDGTEAPCPDWWELGYLSRIEFRRVGAFLVLITHVGIECGFDDSAYLYGWLASAGWRRAWQTEQNTYTEKDYKPQNIESVQVSPYSASNDYLVLTLGTQPWCSSNWRPVYYRVFRPGLDPESKPLIDGYEGAYLGWEPAIQGSIAANDALVEFADRSIDAGVHSRKVIRHYKIDHDQVTRVDPIALSPRDFAEEWLTHEWAKEAAHWSEPDNRRPMLDWHKRLHKDFVGGTKISPTMHCPATPDLWQVGFDLSDPRTPFDKPPKGTYFLVRWRPPYRFTMVSVSDKPFSNCTEKDPPADDQQRTLFPNR
jgi:hypothetical protein